MIPIKDRATPERIIEYSNDHKKGLKMIDDHKKKTKHLKLKAYKVKGDPCNTVFLCKSEERGERAVNNYSREHKIFWK